MKYFATIAIIALLSCSHFSKGPNTLEKLSLVFGPATITKDGNGFDVHTPTGFFTVCKAGKQYRVYEQVQDSTFGKYFANTKISLEYQERINKPR